MRPCDAVALRHADEPVSRGKGSLVQCLLHILELTGLGCQFGVVAAAYRAAAAAASLRTEPGRSRTLVRWEAAGVREAESFPWAA